MDTPIDIKTRDDALAFLARSSIYGNLGLFVGAGFSMAVMDRDFGPVPLSWGVLIETAAKGLGVDWSNIQQAGRSFPQIATEVCEILSKAKGTKFAEAAAELRGEIARLTSWYPNDNERKEFSGLLNDIGPSWIITTNYDLVIESLLTGACVSLGPDDQLLRPANVVPVYHLHGIRTNPSGIVITQEDYIALFRPNEYRQIKLALTIKESVTLLLGYGLGDVNVLTAVDWSRNVFAESKGTYPHGIVQVVRSRTPTKVPYTDKNDVLILETEQLKPFLTELAVYLQLARDFHEHNLEGARELAEQLNNPEANDVTRFIDDLTFRKQLLDDLREYEVHLIAGFVNFFQRCIDETWERAKPSGAFSAYDQNLTMLLDLLDAFDIKKFPPALFETIAYSLDRVAYYIGYSKGESWEAAQTWEGRKGSIPNETLEELKAMCRQSGYYRLYQKLPA
jgi:SIR2-like domain